MYFSKMELQMQNFIRKIHEKNLVSNYKANRDKVCNLYDREFRQNVIEKTPFSIFSREMWKTWYILDFKGKTIIFDERWFDYIVNECDANGNAKPKLINNTYCKLCAVSLAGKESRITHEKLFTHQLRLDYKINRNELKTSDDLIIEILTKRGNATDKVSSQIGTSINKKIKLKNISQKDYIIDNIVKINPHLSTNVDITFTSTTFPFTLGSNCDISLKLTGEFENSSVFIYPIVILAKKYDSKEVLKIVKEINVEITSEYSDLNPTIKYERQKQELMIYPVDVEDFVIPGEAPETIPTTYKELLPLAPYKIPENFKSALFRLTNDDPKFILRSPQHDRIYNHYALELGINKNLTEANYCLMQHRFLYLEEYQMIHDIREYDTTSALKPMNRLFELEVPGLAEARPSLVKFDSIYLKEEKDSMVKYQGIVHKVLEKSVYLGFNERFHKTFIKGKQFFIEFGFNRRPLKVEHQAVEYISKHNINSYFFPPENPQLPSNVVPELNYFNKKLNHEQKQAVRNILVSKNVPYLIFGPPGTGKTSTIVEAILQVWKNQPKSRIFICAPSNSAVNEIAIRLMEVIPKSEMFRLFGSLITADRIHNVVRDISNITSDNNSYLPPMQTLLKFRIMLTTNITAAKLVNGGVDAGHYTHVFLDESGYATESETLVPIVGILSNITKKGRILGQVVLAGDPKQLGPKIHSQFSRYCGLGTSMLERLMDTCKIYARNEEKSIPYDERFVTKLLRNYRSHPTILKISNELFYHNELIAEGNMLSDLFINWESLKNGNVPVIFHNVQGEDKRERNSPSFFNVQETEVVMNYVTQLVNSRVKGMVIREEDVGIITPYRKQVEKIKLACSKKNMHKIDIGTVENFQGREKLIIIITTVRSKNFHNFDEIDRKCQLGFVKNPKRFNVAITRAKALLIVVGNPLILMKDECWLKFITYCMDKKSVAGKKFDLTEHPIVENNNSLPPGASENETDHIDDGYESVDFSRGIH